MSSILYISFDGILEPLGASQVLAYLREIKVLSPGLQIYLVSYEKGHDLMNANRLARFRQDLTREGIHWKFLKYHRRPRLLASLYDFGSGLLTCFSLIRTNKIRIVHSRSLMASLVAAVCHFVFRVKWIFDIRGFWADEKVDGGMWSRNSLKYRLLKLLESKMIQTADEVVTLSRASLSLLPKERTQVIPTCADLQRFRPVALEKTSFKIGYVGSASFSYDLKPALQAMKFISLSEPKVEFSFFNRDHPEKIIRALNQFELSERSRVRSVDFENMPMAIDELSGAVFFIKPTFSKIASCPTKLGELMAMGIPVLTNRGVGDVESLITQYQVGVCISDFSESSIAVGCKAFLNLIKEPGVRMRCRQLADDFFDIKKGARAYLEIYRRLGCESGPGQISI